jgi:hypothetical protein
MTPGAAASTTGKALISRFKKDFLFVAMFNSFRCGSRRFANKKEHITNNVQ